ncbi:MAG: ABC transporter permease [Candidatus Aminicenantes bacterium]|nr:ABC transporter permease [Candidatus Aminicenantes bacterium]
MKKIFHIAHLDLKLTIRDKAFFFWFLAFPMFFILIFGNLYKSNPADKKAALLIVNQDRGQWGNYFVKKLESPDIELDVRTSVPEKIIRMLVIPADFSEKLVTQNSQELQLRKNSAANMEAGAVAETKIVQAIARLLSELIIYGNRNIEDFFAAHTPFNDLVSIETRLPKDTVAVVPSGFDHTIPGTIVQFIMMMVLIYGGVMVLEDRKNRVMERILFSATSFGELFNGKLLGRLLMGLMQAAILIIAGKIFFHLNLGNIFLSSLVVLVFTLAMACLSIFVGSVLHKEELIVAVSVLAGNVFAALGGCWWPAEIIPPTFRILAMVSPAYWAMDAFHQVIFFGKGLASILPNLLILLAFTSVFMVLALRFFKIRE